MKFKKEVEKFNNFKSKINKSVIIIGCGRWGKVILKEIFLNFKNIKKIYVYTKYINQLKKFGVSNKIDKIEILKDLRRLKSLNVNHAIIVKKNKFHYKFAKRLISQNLNILVEKPFTETIEQARSLKKISSKKKLVVNVSLPFLYAHYFYFIKENIIKNNIIKSLNFDWFDKPNEFRHNDIKRFDNKINYLEDIFYHIFSISSIFLGKSNFIFTKKVLKHENFQTMKSLLNKKLVTVNCSRNWSRRVRKLEINLVNKKKISINFSKNVIIKSMGKKIASFSAIKNKTLKYQLFNFLKLNNYKEKNNPNDLRELSKLFVSLKFLKKKLN